MPSSGELSYSLAYGGECGSLHLTGRAEFNVKEEKIMQLQEVDTIQELKEWVSENMAGSIVEEGEGGIVIRTNLISTMGGYLHEREGKQ